jgi:hypothetical protein
MPSAEQVVAESATGLFESWAVGEVLDQGDTLAVPNEPVRRLLAGVDALIRRGLREQCELWPPEWSTDGVSAYRCVRQGALVAEIVGLCWAFTPRLEAHATFPVRASFELDAASDGRLSWFRCDIGEMDSAAGAFPQFAGGTMMLIDGDEPDSVQLLVGRRPRTIAWTPAIDLRFE